MSRMIRIIGIGIYILAAIILYATGQQGLFWTTSALGIVYFAICWTIHSFILSSARMRHKITRKKTIEEGRSKEELDSFDQLPVEISREDFQSVPFWIVKMNKILFFAGFIMLILGIISGIAD